MGVVITIDDIRAYAEVDYIIHHMNQKYIDKVPTKLIDFFSSFKDPNHEVNINPYIPLQNQGLKRYTLEIIALLHLKYWCEDEERKKELYNIMLRNQEKLEEQIKEKYSVDKIFDTTKDDNESNSNSDNDFSKPKMVQRYSQFTQNNSDIQDYTDHVDANNTSVNTQNNNLPLNEDINVSKSFFKRFLERLSKMFKKA